MSEKSERITTRFDKKIYKLFKQFAEDRGEHVSSLLRRLARRELANYSYLSEDEKKALGVVKDE